MSEPENFLSRWSRRKQEAMKPPAATPAEPEASASKPKQDEETKPDAAGPAAEESKFDLSSLPPIDSIGPDTDIRPFLRAGVPLELTRAALRRAWVADPAIRDYIGPSENSWDFTKPGGVPGFDLGDPGVDLRRLAEEMFGGGAKTAAEENSKLPAEHQTVTKEATGPAQKAEQGRIDHELVKPEAEETEKQSSGVPRSDLAAVQQEEVGAVQDQTAERAPTLGSPRRRHGRALPS